MPDIGDILLDKYKILERLGKGLWGEVYLAKDNLDRLVAIKQLTAESAYQDGAIRQGLDATQTVANLEHPSIITIHSLETERKGDTISYYIVMQYASQGTLRRLLERRGKLPITQALDIAIAICRALVIVYYQGVIHRDLKPSNILFCGSKERLEPRLSDFGYQPTLGSPTGRRDDWSYWGSLQYVSPEQLYGEPIDRRSDLFSLGAVLYEMITGAPPFPTTGSSDDIPRIIQSHKTGVQIPPSHKRLEVVEAVDNVIMKALSKEPENRFDDAQEMLQALRDARYVNEWYNSLPEFQAFQRILQKALDSTSLDDIGGGIGSPGEVNEIELLTTLDATVSPVLVYLASAAQSIQLYQERSKRQERKTLLHNALLSITQIDTARSDTLSPYSPLINRIATRWRNLIEAALEALRGEAKLKFNFVSDQAAFSERIDLAVQVTNVGDEIAEELKLSVADAPAYHLVQAGPSQDYLFPGQSLVWEFGLHFTENQPTDVKIAASYRQRGVEGTHVAEFADVITLQDARHFQFIPFPRNGNPYNPGPPVKKDDMLYGRESSVDKIIAELRGLHQDNIIVLYGQRRTGKTSLLYALRRHLAHDAVYLPVFFDAQGRSTPLSFFWGLATAIVDACRAAGLDVAEPGRADFEGDAYAQFEHGFLRPLVKKLDGRRLALMLDEFESLEQSVKTLGDNIFPFFRHMMQHQESLSFIFCGSHQLHELTRDYWSIFFNAARPMRVSFLDEDSTRALITEPVAGHFDYDELALRRLWALTHGHPYFTQYLCYEMVKLMSEREKGYATIQDVNDTLERFIKLGNDHMVSYVWQQSDEAQQAALLALLDVRQPADERIAPRRRVARRAAQVHPEVAGGIGPALEQLIARELLWGDELRIGFTMELVAQWLQAKRSWYDLTGQLTWPGM